MIYTENHDFSPDFTDMIEEAADTIFGPETADQPTYRDGKPVVFGQFAMRRFTPELHELDWHGHIEFNWLSGGAMMYDFEGDQVLLEPDQLCLFWAGIPHRTVALKPSPSENYTLTNMYFPLDIFLSFRGIGNIQRALMAGGVLTLPDKLDCGRLMERWFGDYTSRELERFGCLTMELNALMRRLSLEPKLKDLRSRTDLKQDTETTASATVQVTRMIEFVVQNLTVPMTTVEIASVTGLNANYASNLFRNSVGVTLKQFVTRLRLIRARELILSTDMAVSEAAFTSGFSSTSQFYENYRKSYGGLPSELRKR